MTGRTPTPNGDAVTSRAPVTEKLIRDFIPAIAADSGQHLTVRAASAHEMPALLRRKLLEEAAEAVEADGKHLVEELADVLEVVRVLAAVQGFDVAEVERARVAKASERGGFEQGLVLVASTRRILDEAPADTHDGLERDGFAPDEIADMVNPDFQAQPVQLRWGLNDVMYGDDDATTVMLSGPDGEPYWLELDPGRAAVLREDLVGPGVDAQFQVWPLKRVLAEVRCGSEDWPWEEEWADLDRRHADTGYLDRLEEQIGQNGITMPVLIGSDGRLWDGHHRLRIAVRLGIDYVPVEIVPPGSNEPGAGAETQQRKARHQVPVPVEAFEQLVRVAMWVSRGRSMAFTPDPDPRLGSVYPDATARHALGALDDAGLLQQFRTSP